MVITHLNEPEVQMYYKDNC